MINIEIFIEDFKNYSRDKCSVNILSKVRMKRINKRRSFILDVNTIINSLKQTTNFVYWFKQFVKGKKLS